MSIAQIYGIKNCNTMQKAFAWLDEHGIAYEFHDYKKEGADKALIEKLIAEQGWEKVLNRAGMMWRKLPDEDKASMDADKALAVALEKPSIIKRPLLLKGNDSHFGFSEKSYQDIFA